MIFKKHFINTALMLTALCAAFAACKAKEKAQDAGATEIAVYIPGVVSGSPTYELLVKGVKEAAQEAENVRVTVIEAGYNQAEWETKLTDIAAAGKYDLIVSSNPSLPDIAKPVAAKFPQTRFMLLDGELAGNPSIYTLNYNKAEQAYTLGYLAALLTAEAGGQDAVGLISAQHYPVMDNVILPAYLSGAQAVNAAAKVDFRIVGNWSDAVKALELSNNMIAGGVKVILTIAGAGNEGVVQAASERGAKALWFDTNAYAYRPGVIAGCCATYQDKAAYNKTKDFLAGKLPFGSAETVGMRDGYIDFVDDDPLYLDAVSQTVREKQAAMLEKIRSGALTPVVSPN